MTLDRDRSRLYRFMQSWVTIDPKRYQIVRYDHAGTHYFMLVDLTISDFDGQVIMKSPIWRSNA